MTAATKLDEGRVYHTTRISKWGITLLSGEEWFHLDADGRTLTVEGAVRTAPFLWIRYPFRESRGEVDSTGQHASYEFAWRGARIVQRTRPEGEGVHVVQETDGCRARFVLRRRP